MTKSLLLGAAIAALVVSPVFAQSTSPPASTTAPRAATSAIFAGTSNGAFLEQQDRTQWRVSKLIGARVNGLDEAKIGDINEVLIDSSGNARAVVVGVDGAPGAADKDVAMPFSALTISPSTSGDKIDKVTVAYRKEDLQNAPSFKWTNTGEAGR